MAARGKLRDADAPWLRDTTKPCHSRMFWGPNPPLWAFHHFWKVSISFHPSNVDIQSSTGWSTHPKRVQTYNITRSHKSTEKVTWMGLLLSQVTSARYPAGPPGDDEDARVEGEITWDPTCGYWSWYTFKMFSRNKMKQIHISSDPQTMDACLRYSLVGLYMIIYRVAAFSDDFQQVLLLSLIHFLHRIKSYLHLKEVIGVAYL